MGYHEDPRFVALILPRARCLFNRKREHVFAPQKGTISSPSVGSSSYFISSKFHQTSTPSLWPP